MSWSDKFVGLPYRPLGRDRWGVDCWGLHRLVQSEIRGVDLPSYADAYTSPRERAEIARLVNAAEARPGWRPVDAVEAFDLLLFRVGRYRSHVATAVDRRRMLTVEEGRASVVMALRGSPWQARLVGAFRYEGLS